MVGLERSNVWLSLATLLVIGSATLETSAAATESGQLTCYVLYEHRCDELTCISYRPHDTKFVFNDSIGLICDKGECSPVEFPTKFKQIEKHLIGYGPSVGFIKVDPTTGEFVDIKTFDFKVIRCEGSLIEESR
ncbi:MAG: hypothetical protein ACPGOY_18830 [Rhodospirillaceae bacterium]